MCLTTMVGATAASDEHNDPPEVANRHYEDDSHIFLQPQWTTGLLARVESGELPDRRGRGLAPANPAPPAAPGSNCITSAQFFPVEDTDGLFLADFPEAAALNFLYDAGEQLIAAHGDNYDFIGFWVNFEPHHTLGSAFYLPLANDVEGIGLPFFNSRPFTVTNSERVMGLVMMWDINDSQWQPGDGFDAAFVRLVLGQEFAHRYGMYLPPLLDGRRLQGDNLCARSEHWDWRVDGQGSSMELIEWLDQDPALIMLTGNFPLAFNTDIPGGVWSYTDLYLMGYVTPAEMDAGNSELRYVDDWPCKSPVYFGPISDFDSSDIIASAGVRIPDAVSPMAQKHYRTGWIMIHQPGDEPDQAELDKAAGILQQHAIDWSYSTLGRGTVDNTIFNDCNCNGVADSDDIAGGASADVNGNGVPDECECPADLDSSGDVGTGDLLTLLGAWGTDPGGPPDFDGDGVVNGADLIVLLGAWGPCR